MNVDSTLTLEKTKKATQISTKADLLTTTVALVKSEIIKKYDIDYDTIRAKCDTFDLTPFLQLDLFKKHINYVCLGGPYTGKSYFMHLLSLHGYGTLDIGKYIRDNSGLPKNSFPLSKNEIWKILRQSGVLRSEPFIIGKILQPDILPELAMYSPLEFLIFRRAGPIPYFKREKDHGQITQKCREYIQKYQYIEDLVIRTYPHRIIYIDEEGFWAI